MQTLVFRGKKGFLDDLGPLDNSSAFAVRAWFRSTCSRVVLADKMRSVTEEIPV